MKKTLANLERHEQAIREAFENGMQEAVSMREHLFVIRSNGLYEAAGADNFEQYCKMQRLPFGRSQAYQIAANGEVVRHIEKSSVSDFSDRALSALGKLRVSGTNQIDARKVRTISRKAIESSQEITGRLINDLIEKQYGPKPAKPLGEQLEAEGKRIDRFRLSLEGLQELEPHIFVDAESEYAGSVSRLAKKYSALASLLKGVLR